MVVSGTFKYDEPDIFNLGFIIFEYRSNDCASSVLLYDQPLA